MAYKIDAKGTADLGGTFVPVPNTVSDQARAFLAASPWGDAPPVEGPAPMWEARAAVDAVMAQLNEVTRAVFPVDIEEIAIRGVRCHLVKPREAMSFGD